MGAADPGSPRRVMTGITLLAAVAAAGVIIATLVHDSTRLQIAENQRTAILRTLHELVRPQSYDNDLLADATRVIDPERLGTPQPVIVYRATMKGVPVAVIISSVAPDGYGGPIRLLIGIDDTGVLTGVRIAGHQETPGLGAAISQDRSDWITVFPGRSLVNPDPSGWTVRKDGGYFDQFTGATISPRVTVQAIHNALIYFSEHADSLFADLTDKAP